MLSRSRQRVRESRTTSPAGRGSSRRGSTAPGRGRPTEACCKASTAATASESRSAASGRGWRGQAKCRGARAAERRLTARRLQAVDKDPCTGTWREEFAARQPPYCDGSGSGISRARDATGVSRSSRPSCPSCPSCCRPSHLERRCDRRGCAAARTRTPPRIDRACSASAPARRPRPRWQSVW
jgi:hypothetical protein